MIWIVHQVPSLVPCAWSLCWALVTLARLGAGIGSGLLVAGRWYTIADYYTQALAGESQHLWFVHLSSYCRIRGCGTITGPGDAAPQQS